MQDRVPARLRAVGVIRVSEVGKRDRESESFITAREQREQFTSWCARHAAELVEVVDEIDVSGKLVLAKRRGLLRALELIEGGLANVLLFAYFDRSFRNLDVQNSVLARIIEAGGATYACDFGEIRFGTPAERFATTVQGAANQLTSDQAAYKAMNARRDAVARGVPPFSRLCLGYVRGSDGRVAVDPTLAPLVTKMFNMRADGATLKDCQQFLADNGVVRSYSSVKATLASKMVLGELHAGKHVTPNLESHTAIVDRVTWQRVQRAKVPRGRVPLPDGRLLGRMGLLRCGSCGRAMSSGGSRSGGKTYRTYVCGVRADCPRPVSINATLVERLVADECRRYLAGRAQSAGLDSKVREAEDRVAHAEEALDGAIGLLAGIERPSARTRLLELQRDLAEAIDALNVVQRQAGPLELVRGDVDWDRLSLDERRGLIRAIFRSITVHPTQAGIPRDASALTFEPFVE